MQSSIYTEDSFSLKQKKIKKSWIIEELSNQKKRSKRDYSKERERKRNND